MPKYIAAYIFIILFVIVISRTLYLNRVGIKAMKFGEIDRKDFFIPPVAVLYFYIVFSNAFGTPAISRHMFFYSNTAAWIGAALCLAGLMLFLWSMVSFGRSFRVGIDLHSPGELITTGAFAFSRNPIYVAFALVLTGQFLVFPNWILLAYLVMAIWLFDFQVLREEEFLKRHYGEEYLSYCKKVRRYL